MTALPWVATRMGVAHAIPDGHRRALCGRPPRFKGDGWRSADGKPRCVNCTRIAAWPAAELAGRIAALPPVPEPSGPRERYLTEKGLLP